MKHFWRVCRWAAVGLIGLATIFVVLQGAMLLDHKYELGMFKGCEFLIMGFSCRNATGGAILDILLNLPFLVLFTHHFSSYAPFNRLLNTGSIGNPVGIGFTTLITIANVWLILGIIGILRSVAGLGKWLSNTRRGG